MNSQYLAACWSLVRGNASGFAESDWPGVFQRCVMDRCAPLAWARSRELIEAQAPTEVSVKWASAAWSSQETTAAHLAAVRELTPWFVAHDVRHMVLKGLPLSQRLYGVSWARPTDDLDLYIDPADHAVADELIRATGWTHFSGVFPADTVFRKVMDGHPVAIDVHFSLAGPWHRHLPFPAPVAERVTVDGDAISALGGAFLPVFLAAHLLQHAKKPLLWLVDFKTLWDSLTGAERADAMAAAREARLHRVLHMAIRWSRSLAVLSPDATEAAELRLIHGVLRPSRSRVVGHILWTSASIPDAGRVLSRFLWPEEVGDHPGALLKLWMRRFGRILAPSRR